jgi:hypothetical protein
MDPETLELRANHHAARMAEKDFYTFFDVIFAVLCFDQY